MAQLFSDLVDAQGRRYFFNLKSAPGGIAPTPAVLNIVGFAPTVFQHIQAFRTPAPAVLTLNGLSVAGQPRPIPSTANIALVGLAPTLLLQRVVTNATPTPDYNPPQGLAPTILFINTVTPAPAQLSLVGLEPNASPGGNIAYVTPAPAQLTLGGLAPTLLFLEVGTGQLLLEGLAPTLLLSTTVTPEPGQITLNGLPVSVSRPFGWVDVNAPPVLLWTTTTGINP